MKTNRVGAAHVSTSGSRLFAMAAQMFVILGCMLALACPAFAQERPFKGRIDGQFVTAPTAIPWIVTSQVAATGKGTHVGAFTKVTSDVIDLSTLWVVGAFTMTTANGDLLMGVYSGPLAFGNSPCAISWILNATIVGGTGRFQHATGEFVFIAEGEIVISDGVAHGSYTETFDGIIDY